MMILGIDPGSSRMGFGAIRKEGSRLIFVEAGVIGISSKRQAAKLEAVGAGLETLFARIAPERVGIERLFFSKNEKTAMEVAEARGLAIYIAMKYCRDPERIMEFTPQEAKRSTANWGGAGKKAVARMVAAILGMPEMDVLDDATDALAIAICAANARVPR